MEMAYNIHPIFVHFPIALLFLYSLIKMLPLQKWFPKVSWKHIEILLLVVGVLGAFAALVTGDTAKHLVHPNRQLVGMHSTFAQLATWLYGLLLVGEILTFLTSKIIPRLNVPILTKFFIIIQKILTQPTLSKGIAFVALIAITVTGMLGGVMVYGVSADPVAAEVLHVLGISSQTFLIQQQGSNSVQ